MTILLYVDIFGTPIVMSGNTGHRKKKFLHVSSWTINVGIAHILIRDMTPPQKKTLMCMICSAATMYGNTEMYGNAKKSTEMYGWKVGVLSVQKYVRMYGILEKN